LDQEGIILTELCQVHILIQKFFQDFVTCDVVDMKVCHILLGRSWQYEVHAKHKDKKNIYMFLWKDKKIALRLVGDQT